jgi:glycosyltransferase involved in cell wall biosynthesis
VAAAALPLPVAHRLRVALLTYRGNPHSGGQGVYVRHLSRALADLGHHLTVFSGPPYPQLDRRIRLVRLPSLDLYRPEQPFRGTRPVRNAIDAAEWALMCGAAFPEPLTFSLRAWRVLSAQRGAFDVVHDNQCLGYGLLPLARILPVMATVHHPIAIDRRLELAAARNWRRRLGLRRWYSFTRMQGRVARRLPRILTVSQAARNEIVREMGVDPARVRVVANGVDPDVFRPLPAVRHVAGRIIATASADVPLKGLLPLLEAIGSLRRRRLVSLVVVGRARPFGAVAAAVDRLGLDGDVTFLGGVDEDHLVRLYAEAEIAVVPSLYEGFSLPAIEAMASGVPLVATSAGGLPEVVGEDGGAGLLVPPGDSSALAAAIERLLDDAALRTRLGQAGRLRATMRFSWSRAAEETALEYTSLVGGC